MTIVTSSEFQKNFGYFKEVAQREPVTVTSNGRESVILLSMAEYKEYLNIRNERYLYGGEVSEKFGNDVNSRILKHNKVLEDLA